MFDLVTLLELQEQLHDGGDDHGPQSDQPREHPTLVAMLSYSLFARFAYLSIIIYLGD